MNPDLRGQVRSLRARLSPRSDVVAAAEEARQLFFRRHDPQRTRWLELELGGYRNITAANLHEVFGPGTDARLLAHVTAYRVQRARTETAPITEFRHLFVEPLADLRLARDNVRKLEARGHILPLQFLLPVGTPTHPANAVFSRDVFERVVGGFVAALHLQLGAIG